MKRNTTVTTSRQDWWNTTERKGQKRAGLSQDEFVWASLYCATKRALQIRSGSEPFTGLVMRLARKTWSELSDGDIDQIRQYVYHPLYKAPIGYSIFPSDEKWKDLAAMQEIKCPDGLDLLAIMDLVKHLQEYRAAGWRPVFVNCSSEHAKNAAVHAIMKMENLPKVADWDVRVDAPVPPEHLAKYVLEQALNEGEVERAESFTCTVRAKGRKEERGTLVPLHHFNSWEIFGEFEEFDATGKPGNLINAVRL